MATPPPAPPAPPPNAGQYKSVMLNGKIYPTAATPDGNDLKVAFIYPNQGYNSQLPVVHNCSFNGNGSVNCTPYGQTSGPETLSLTNCTSGKWSAGGGPPADAIYCTYHGSETAIAGKSFLQAPTSSTSDWSSSAWIWIIVVIVVVVIVAILVTKKKSPQVVAVA